MRRDLAVVEARYEAQQRWADHARAQAERIVAGPSGSWFDGASIPGKARRPLFFFGSSGLYAARARVSRRMATRASTGTRRPDPADLGAATRSGPAGGPRRGGPVDTRTPDPRTGGGPQVHRTPEDIGTAVRALRASGRRIAFVPTMGALHAGHRELIRQARRASGDTATGVPRVSRSEVTPAGQPVRLTGVTSVQQRLPRTGLLTIWLSPVVSSFRPRQRPCGEWSRTRSE